MHPPSSLYGADGFIRLPVLEVDNGQSITRGSMDSHSQTLHTGDTGVPGVLCPARSRMKFASELQELAIRAHTVLGTRGRIPRGCPAGCGRQPRLLRGNQHPAQFNSRFQRPCASLPMHGLRYRMRSWKSSTWAPIAVWHALKPKPVMGNFPHAPAAPVARLAPLALR